MPRVHFAPIDDSDTHADISLPLTPTREHPLRSDVPRCDPMTVTLEAPVVAALTCTPELTDTAMS